MTTVILYITSFAGLTTVILPVMIHRAIFGSLERFIGILIENTMGAFPVWLAPLQAMIIPITDDQNSFGGEVLARLKAAGLRAEIDTASERMQKKIRAAQLQKVPYMLVIGAKEAEAGTVAVRLRSGEDLGAMNVDEFIKTAVKMAGQKTPALWPENEGSE